MTYSKVTRENLENAIAHLAKLLPDNELVLEYAAYHGYRVRRIDHSTPFGSNYYSKRELYDVLWFAIAALDMACMPLPGRK